MNIYYLRKFRRKAFKRYKVVQVSEIEAAIYDYHDKKYVGLKLSKTMLEWGLHRTMLKQYRDEYIVRQLVSRKYKKENKIMAKL